MKRLAVAVLALAAVASADELQRSAPAFCNGQGYCGSQLTALALDAGVEQVVGDFGAFHVVGNHNAPKPTCLSPGGWWKTCTVVQGDNFTGTIVLSDGDAGFNPVFASLASIALIQPSIPFPNGGGCMVQIGNIDAGQYLGSPALILGQYYDGGCNVELIKGITGNAGFLNHGIALNYMMGGL